MKKLNVIAVFISLLFLGGCYTQIALREPVSERDEYVTDEEQYAEEPAEYDTLVAKDSDIYYDDYGNTHIMNYGFPSYRRYLWGYYPYYSNIYSDWYWDSYWGYLTPGYSWPNWWWYYGGYYGGYWPGYYGGYYGHYPYAGGYYQPSEYKYRTYYPHSRDNDGGRGTGITDRYRTRDTGDRNSAVRDFGGRSGRDGEFTLDPSKMRVGRGGSASGSGAAAKTNPADNRERTGSTVKKYYSPVTIDRTGARSDGEANKSGNSTGNVRSGDNSSRSRDAGRSTIQRPSVDRGSSSANRGSSSYSAPRSRSSSSSSSSSSGYRAPSSSSSSSGYRAPSSSSSSSSRSSGSSSSGSSSSRGSSSSSSSSSSSGRSRG